MDTIGKRLLELRKSLNLTIADVASKTGLARSNLSRIENDKHDPSARTIIALAEFYHVSTDWILRGWDKDQAGIAETTAVEYDTGIKVSDRNLRLALRALSKMWLEGDKNMHGWIIVQLCKTFPEIEERLKTGK